MAGFLGKLFGSKKDKKDSPMNLVEDTLAHIIELGSFSLSFDISANEDQSIVDVEFYGDDEEVLVANGGDLLDAMQLYCKRVVQHQMIDRRIEINFDSNGFRAENNEALVALAEKLRDLVLTKGKSVYVRALPPKDRKVVHQHLAEDGRVKSRSVGDGHFKKIKIYAPKSGQSEGRSMSQQ